MEQLFKKQIMGLYENTLDLAKVVNNLQEQVKRLEETASTETNYLSFCLSAWTTVWIAERNLDFKNMVLELSKTDDPHDGIDKEAMERIFKTLTDYLEDPGKKKKPDWFGGVIQGGKKEDPVGE